MDDKTHQHRNANPSALHLSMSIQAPVLTSRLAVDHRDKTLSMGNSSSNPSQRIPIDPSFFRPFPIQISMQAYLLANSMGIIHSKSRVFSKL